MPIQNGLFSSESVSEGHPDKLADQYVIVAGEFRIADPSVCQGVRRNTVALVAAVLP
jgi:S-adenosylmethionine synthetase